MKKIKAVFYGEPGVGKSTFLSKSPNPFYICTDGNYEWLGLPEENHTQLSSWAQAKVVFADIIAGKYNQYDTIVVDLIEDLYTWCEYEFCKRMKIEHLSDYKSMGAGYAVVRQEFFVEISKLISVDKNIIFLSHEVIKTEKDRRGTENHKHYPSDKMSIEKVWVNIEGEVRYFLRCYMKPEEVNGRTVKKRYLSLIPKENEYGIARGIDEATTPEDIPLDWDTFAEVIGLNKKELPTTNAKPIVKPKVEELPKVVEAPKPIEEKPIEQPKVEVVETKPIEQPKVEQPKADISFEALKARLQSNKQESQVINDLLDKDEEPAPKVVEAPKPEPTTPQAAPSSAFDKDSILAKLNAMKNNK